MSDPKSLAKAYLEKNKVGLLFEILGSKLAVLKPDDPNEFIISELSKMSSVRARGEKVTLFNEKDVSTMFNIFDITNRGFLTQAQYIRAVNYVGIEKPSLPVPEAELIDKETFVKHLTAELNTRAI